MRLLLSRVLLVSTSGSETCPPLGDGGRDGDGERAGCGK